MKFKINVKKKEYGYFSLDFLICTAIVVLNFFCVQSRSLPCFLDEYGYWANAGHLAGYDWSGIGQNMSYFAYGYSVLLAIIMLLVPNPLYWMKAAVLLNLVSLLIIYFLFCAVARRICENDNPILIRLIAFALTFYPQMTYSTATTWSEPLSVIAYLGFICCLAEYMRNPGFLKSFILALLCAVSYYIHHRFLGLICAALVILILCCIENKKKYWKSVCVFIVIFAAVFCLMNWVNNWFIVSIFKAKGVPGTQTAQVDKQMINSLGGLFSFNVIRKLFLNVLGRIFSFNTSYYLFFIPSFGLLLKCIYQSFKENRKHMCKVYLFILLSFLFTLAISVIFMYEPNRVDIVFYARYMEPFIYPIIILGVYKIIVEGCSCFYFSICDFIYIICGIVSCWFLESSNATLFYMGSVPALYKYYRIYFTGSHQEFVYGMTTITILLGSGIIWLANKKKRTGMGKYKWLLSLLLMIFLWKRLGEFAVTFRYGEAAKILSNCSAVTETVLDDYKPVWVVTDDMKETCSETYVFNIQFLMPDREIHVVQEEMFKDNPVPAGYILIDNKNSNIDTYDFGQELISNTEFTLFRNE